MTRITYIPGEIANAAIDEHGNRKPVTRTQHIFDDAKGKSQAEVNADVDDKFTQVDNEIEALEKQDVIPVDTLPAVATADPKKIYRVVGEDSYTDHMVNATGDGWKTLATYSFPGIDDNPTAGSDNLVKSGGVKNYGNNIILEINKTDVGEFILDNEPIYNFTIYNGVWTNSNYCQLIPVIPNSYIVIDSGDYSVYAFLKSNTIVEGSDADFADGCSVTMIQANSVITPIQVPSDANYLYVYKGTHGNRYVSVYLYDKYNVELDNKLTTYSPLTINFRSEEAYDYTTKLVTATSANYKSACFEVVPFGKYLIVTSSKSRPAVMVLDSSYNLISRYEGYATDSIPIVEHLYKIEIPSNGKYICVNCFIGSGDLTPTVNVAYTYNAINTARSTIEENTNEKYIGAFKIENNLAVLGTVSVDWCCRKVSVKPNDSIGITTNKYGSTYSGYFLTDENDTYILGDTPVGASVVTPTEVSFVVPAKGKYLYVNNRSATGASIRINGVDSCFSVSPLSIKIGAVNCGAFSYYEGATTAEEYLQNWRSMLNSLDYDIMILSDFKARFASGDQYNNALNLLFGGQVYKSMILGMKIYDPDGGLIVVSRNKNIKDVEVFDVTNTIDDYTTWRYKVYNVVVYLNDNKSINIYAVHLAPGENATSVRAAQYQDIVDRITQNKESAIIAGDYNAWTAGEYDVFKNAGYNIGNCGYTGTHLTLRDIPADNIITTQDILIKKFEMVEGFNLNTDHKPILASLCID